MSNVFKIGSEKNFETICPFCLSSIAYGVEDLNEDCKSMTTDGVICVQRFPHVPKINCPMCHNDFEVEFKDRV